MYPGDVKTDLFVPNGGGFFIAILQKVVLPLIGVELEEGAKNQLWAATAKGIVSGEYYNPVGITGKSSKLSQDEKLIEKFWNWTQEELKGQDL